MKHFVYILLAAISVLLTMQSCADDTIGGSLTDTRTAIIEDSSFAIMGHSVANQRLQARTSTQLVGLIKSDGYGTLRSEVVTQFIPSTMIDTMGVTSDMIDSCRLRLCIPVAGGFTGDSLPPMRLSVYRLNKPLPTPLYSDFDPTDYYDESDLLGTNAYSPKSAEFIYNSETQETNRAIYIPMPVSLAREMQQEYRNHPETFASPSAFAKFFPGVYITNTFGSGRVMNFNRTEFDVYFRQVTTTINGTDTIQNKRRTYMAASPETVQDNIISLDVDASIQERVANGEAIVMAPAGYEVQLRFPVQDIIDSFNRRVGSDLGVINKLELTIPVEDTGTQYDIAPPPYLLMVKTSQKDKFIAGDSLANNKDSFYAVYNSSKRCYVFGGLRPYILNIINNQHGIATEDDINLTVTPVDVTTYTTQATYYTQAQTVVTKIAPMVSAPAITRLRLDKAKVKITYSMQTM